MPWNPEAVCETRLEWRLEHAAEAAKVPIRALCKWNRPEARQQILAEASALDVERLTGRRQLGIHFFSKLPCLKDPKRGTPPKMSPHCYIGELRG